MRPLHPALQRGFTLVELMVTVTVLAVIMALAMVWIYVIEGSKYVSTDNAQVDGDKISIVAPSSGYLVDWTGKQGTQLIENHVLGRIKNQAGFAQPQQPIMAPGAGTIPQRPLPGPASLGQFDGDDMRPVAPLSDVQRLEVLHERLATVIDPGVVKVDMVDGAVTLRGTVRDAATRKAVEGIAKGCLSDYYVRSEIDVSEGRTSR